MSLEEVSVRFVNDGRNGGELCFDCEEKLKSFVIELAFSYVFGLLMVSLVRLVVSLNVKVIVFSGFDVVQLICGELVVVYGELVEVYGELVEFDSEPGEPCGESYNQNPFPYSSHMSHPPPISLAFPFQTFFTSTSSLF
jgi:hypothetical protein